MKFFSKTNLILVVVSCLLVASLYAFVSPKQVKAEDVSYNKKIVAVVYDDSGSMDTSRRVDYAKYAMQVLMATLDSRDVLRVFPLNNSAFDVDLTNPDRNAVIKSNLNKLGSSGGTDPAAITSAVNWLATNHGLNKNSTVEGKEFKLIIITDGEFNGGNSGSKTVGDRISGYMGLQTSFLGISLSNSKYMVDELASQNSSVKGYYATNATEIVSQMQLITNMTTGRYKMSNGITYDVNDRRIVYVDLNDYNFSIISLGVLAQSNGASVALKSVDYSIPLIQARACNLSSSNVGLYGYSAMLSCQSENTHQYLYKDKVTLTFESAPTDVLILLEPAIKLTSSLQYNDGNNWVDVTEQEVNATLRSGQEVRTRYHLVDFNTTKDLTTVLTDVDVKVSYDGKIYKYDDVITLIDGKNELALAVSVNISGADYVLYDSWVCDIDVDPMQFRIDTNVIENYNGDSNKVKIDYTVYYDYKLATQNQLSGTNKLFSWEVVSLTDPDGKNVAYESNVSGGTVSIIFNKQTGKYGDYKVSFKVVRNENAKTRFSNVEIQQSLTKLVIAKSNDLELTLHKLTNNTSPIAFSITDDGCPIDYNSNLIDYSLTIDGYEVTDYLTVQNDKLVFVPDKNMPSYLQQTSVKDVVFEVWSPSNPSLKAKVVSKLSIIESHYSVEVVTTDDKVVDIYNLKDSQTKIYYKLKIDGDDISKEDILIGLDSGLINVNTKKFGWIFMLPTAISTDVVNVNGEDLLCVSITSNWKAPLDSLFASFIITGDKTISVTCGNGTGDGVVTLKSVNFFTRLWRWLVIFTVLFIIVHTILWIIGFFVAKQLPKGALVQIKLNPDKPKFIASVSSITINTQISPIIMWHLKRYIPFNEFANQDSISAYNVSLQVVNGAYVMVHNKKSYAIRLSLDDDDASEAIKKYRKFWQTYSKGNKPTLKLTTKEILNLVDDLDKEINLGRAVGLTEDYYATKNLKGKIETIIFFKYIY